MTSTESKTTRRDMAEGIVYRAVQDQAGMLAYLDDFRLLAVVFVLLIPFVFLLHKPKGGEASAPPH
jgi:hypothetical protein